MVAVSTAGVVQSPLPAGPVPPGTLVWGADFNAACALLYRFWGLLDAPAGLATAPQWDDLFAASCAIALPQAPRLDVAGLRAHIAAGRLAGSSAHHLGYDHVRVVCGDDQELALEASYAVARRLGSREPVRHDESVRIALVRDADGLRIASLEAAQRSEPRPAPFEPSFLVNRARATMVQFQAYMDSLSGRLGTIVELLADELELHGLVASKQDRSGADGDLTDVNALRKSVAGSAEVADNLIRTHAEFAGWFATAPALFRYGLHKLEHFAVGPLGNQRFETVAQFDWRAETLNGAKIETHHPLTWILVETGEKYMRIEKLMPFG